MARSSKAANPTEITPTRDGPGKPKPAHRLEMVHKPISWFQPYPHNPRKNDKAVDLIIASLDEFGFAVPALARSTGEVVDGHLRLKGAAKMNWPHLIPVVLCDGWTDAQVKAFRILVNRSVNWGEWDDDLLAQELADLQAMGYDCSQTGFDDIELLKLLERQEAAGSLADEDAVPELPDVVTSRPGDLWVLGEPNVCPHCGEEN